MTLPRHSDGPVIPAGPFGRLRDMWSARADQAAGEAEVDRLVWAWREACEGAGACTTVDTPTGPTVSTPRITDVVLGPPTVLTVHLLPGQLSTDLRRAAHRIAPHMGAVMLRVTDLAFGWVTVELLYVDPLAGVLALDVDDPTPGVLVGRCDDGVDVREDWRDLAHMIVQGVTRSGKSVLTYGLLAQFARDPLVTVCGCDPTGLLFRPFDGTRHADWQVSGVADPEAHVKVLARLVDEMDERIRRLPADRDTLEVTAADPMRVVVLEELAGLYRAVDAADKDAGKRIRALIGRLLAEGAKVGVRVIILVQRAEAAVVGAFERAMCSWRISFRVDNHESVKLLHPDVPQDVSGAHTTAAPGIALMSAPGREVSRIRAPFIGGYGQYAAAIRAA